MKSWRVLLAVLFFSSLTSLFGGPVLIYRGAGNQAGISNAISAGPVNIYVLIDPGSDQVSTIVYYTRGQQKRIFAISASAYRSVSFTLVTGKTSVVYNRSDELEGGGDFIDIMRALRGTQGSLKVFSQALVPFVHPRVINGFEFFSSNTDGEQASELRYTASFQQARTIKANDGNQTIAQAFNALVTELNAKGFVN